MIPANSNRPLEGQALQDILHELAMINTVAGMLKLNLEPLDQEDIAAGAEALTPEQINEDLDKICNIVTRIAIASLQAQPAEWYAANDSIE